MANNLSNKTRKRGALRWSIPVLVGLCASMAVSAPLFVGAKAAAAASLPTVTIGYENNGADPEMVAIAQGFFEKYMHAHVVLRLFSSGPAALAATGSGSLQFMTGIGNPPVVSAIAQGAPLQVIWAQERYTYDEGLAVKNNSGIRSMKDLKGKTVALVLGSTSPFELQVGLKKAGVPVNSVHLLNMSPPEMRAAWINGQIQAAYVWDPVFNSLLADHGHPLMYDQTVAQQAPIFNLTVVNSTWAAQHKSEVVGFIRAELAGVAFYQQHRAQALHDMAMEAGISIPLAKAELRGYQIDTAKVELGPDGLGRGKGVATSLVTKSLTSAAAYLYSSNTISNLPSHMERFVNPTYVENAVSGK